MRERASRCLWWARQVWRVGRTRCLLGKSSLPHCSLPQNLLAPHLCALVWPHASCVTLVCERSKVDMAPHELLLAVHIPFTREHEFTREFKQSPRRDDDIAIVNAGGLCLCDACFFLPLPPVPVSAAAHAAAAAPQCLTGRTPCLIARTCAKPPPQPPQACACAWSSGPEAAAAAMAAGWWPRPASRMAAWRPSPSWPRRCAGAVCRDAPSAAAVGSPHVSPRPPAAPPHL